MYMCTCNSAVLDLCFLQDCTKFKSDKTGRGPLCEGWMVSPCLLYQLTTLCILWYLLRCPVSICCFVPVTPRWHSWEGIKMCHFGLLLCIPAKMLTQQSGPVDCWLFSEVTRLSVDLLIDFCRTALSPSCVHTRQWRCPLRCGDCRAKLSRAYTGWVQIAALLLLGVY